MKNDDIEKWKYILKKEMRLFKNLINHIRDHLGKNEKHEEIDYEKIKYIDNNSF